MEEANPFMFHEALAESKVETIEIDEEVASETEDKKEATDDSAEEAKGGEESEEEVK